MVTIFNICLIIKDRHNFWIKPKAPIKIEPQFPVITILVDNFYAGKRLTFSMDIRTHNCTGILLYVATALYPDHLLLELADGRV